MKKYKDENRPQGVCYDCRIPYNEFEDLIVSDSMWEKINPTYHEGAGLLCPNCIGKRIRKLNLQEPIKAVFP